MTDLILKAMIPAILEKLRDAGPGVIAALLGFLTKIADVSNVDKAMAWVRGRYESLTASIAGWARKPTTVPSITTRFETALNGVEKLLEKKKK